MDRFRTQPNGLFVGIHTSKHRAHLNYVLIVKCGVIFSILTESHRAYRCLLSERDSLIYIVGEFLTVILHEDSTRAMPTNENITFFMISDLSVRIVALPALVLNEFAEFKHL